MRSKRRQGANFFGTGCLWIKQARIQQWIYKPKDWLADAYFHSLQTWNRIWSPGWLHEMFRPFWDENLSWWAERSAMESYPKCNAVDLCLWVRTICPSKTALCALLPRIDTSRRGGGSYKLSLKTAHLQQDSLRTHVLQTQWVRQPPKWETREGLRPTPPVALGSIARSRLEGWDKPIHISPTEAVCPRMHHSTYVTHTG